MRLGVFGGTFDPPHIGHLVVAQEAIHQLGLDRLLIVPAAVPPHKRGKRITDGALRLEMLEAATRGLGDVEVSGLELERDGPSYTVDTLRALRSEHPDAELFLVLGADQVRELDTWHEAEEVAKLAILAPFRREGQEPVAPPGAGGAWRMTPIRIPRLDISSTAIRERAAAGDPIGFLVPDAVRSIIERERLYDSRDG